MVTSWDVYLGEINLHKYFQHKHTICFGNKNEKKKTHCVGVINIFQSLVCGWVYQTLKKKKKNKRERERLCGSSLTLRNHVIHVPLHHFAYADDERWRCNRDTIVWWFALPPHSTKLVGSTLLSFRVEFACSPCAFVNSLRHQSRIIRVWWIGNSKFSPSVNGCLSQRGTELRWWIFPGSHPAFTLRQLDRVSLADPRDPESRNKWVLKMGGLHLHW